MREHNDRGVCVHFAYNELMVATVIRTPKTANTPVTQPQRAKDVYAREEAEEGAFRLAIMDAGTTRCLTGL